MKNGIYDYEMIVHQLLACEADIYEILEHLEASKLYDCALSLRDIAKVLKLSKSRVRQIEKAAIKKLKVQLERKYIAD